MTHTVMPLLKRDLLVITDECEQGRRGRLAQARRGSWTRATRPISCRSRRCRCRDVEVFGKRGGRFGSHNMHENYPGPCSWRSDQIVVGAFFNAGVRVYDISNPFQPQEIAYFVPGRAEALAQGRDPDQRRVRRRSRDRVRGGSLQRRAVHPRDERVAHARSFGPSCWRRSSSRRQRPRRPGNPSATSRSRAPPARAARSTAPRASPRSCSRR